MLTLIVDDHALFGEGLRLLLLAAMPGAEVVCCDGAAAALRLAQERAFELVLLDWNLGAGVSGPEVLAELKRLLPAARVVIVSGDFDPALVRRAIDGGAVGFVPKESPPGLLIDALTITADGGIFLPRAAGSEARGRADLRAVRESYPGLTPRHVDVLDLVVRGMSNKQIARTLDISEGTVKQHLNAIFRELQVDNRTEAVYLLARSGMKFD